MSFLDDRLTAILCLCVAASNLLCSGAYGASKEIVLASLTAKGGADPVAGLIMDKAGNLYGTASYGGSAASAGGTVFKLSPPAAGKTAWSETTLVNFDGPHGQSPSGSLIADSDGNLYGTTSYGGKFNQGTIFKLSPPPAGKTEWALTVLFSFKGLDGAQPYAGLLADAAGNLYGTTAGGGPDFGTGNAYANGSGTVFKLAPPAPGTTDWTETVLFSFAVTNALGQHAYGQDPFGSLIADSAGNLYGTTSIGGTGDGLYGGTAFKLTRPAARQTAWTATVLYEFNPISGTQPFGTFLADKTGNLYGTTNHGGASGPGGGGTVFELSPPAAGQTAWTETVLFSFRNQANGFGNYGSLIAVGAGNLYGTTEYGGPGPYNDGVIYKLAAPAAAKKNWKETILATFKGPNGCYPSAGLIADNMGNFYGATTIGGGTSGCNTTYGNGVVFKLTP
jgi:uncharacterized repeat protein (TIGR03803 family)